MDAEKLFQCVKQEFTLFVSLFLQKISCPLPVSYKLGTLQLIFQKFYYTEMKV